MNEYSHFYPITSIFFLNIFLRLTFVLEHVKWFKQFKCQSEMSFNTLKKFM